MIRYMTVERIDRSQSKESKLLSLPFYITSLEDFDKLEIPKYKKLMVLAEQYILAKSIDDMMYQDNVELSQFLTMLKHEAQSSLETLQHDISQHTYSSYKAGVEFLLRDFTVLPSLLDMFNDYQVYPEEHRLLPKEFWKPFLEISQGAYSKIQYTYPNALMLYPTLEDDVVVFRGIEGICKYKKDIPDMSLNKQLYYLEHFDWNATNWPTLLGVISSFCIDSVSKLKSNRSVSHFLKAITEQSTSTMINYSEVRYQLLNILRDSVSSIDETPHVENISYLLEKLNLDKDIISAFTSKNPTGRDIMHLSNKRDLEFLKGIVLHRATEAAEGLDDTDADEDDEFNMDTMMDDSGDMGSDDSFGDDSFDDLGSDSMDGDLGDTSSMFGDDSGFGDDSDSFGDFGGDDTSTNTPEPKENAVEVPDNPIALALRIVNSETFDDYLARNAFISAINAILIDPPATLSGEDLKFLRIWVTQWINFFPIETTKSMLSKLSVYLTDAE